MADILLRILLLATAGLSAVLLLRRRAGFLAIAVLLAGGLWFVGGYTVAQAATPAPAASRPPSVDVAYKNRHPPQYPIAAIKKGEQGTVVLEVKVDATGQVLGISVDQSETKAAALLQQAAIAAASRWRFNPGVSNGKPVGGVVRIPVDFSLREIPPRSKPPIVLRAYVDAKGNVTIVTVDEARSISTSPELRARAISKVKELKFNRSRDAPKMPAGWYVVPFWPAPTSGPASSSE